MIREIMMRILWLLFLLLLAILFSFLPLLGIAQSSDIIVSASSGYGVDTTDYFVFEPQYLEDNKISITYMYGPPTSADRRVYSVIGHVGSDGVSGATITFASAYQYPEWVYGSGFRGVALNANKLLISSVTRGALAAHYFSVVATVDSDTDEIVYGVPYTWTTNSSVYANVYHEDVVVMNASQVILVYSSSYTDANKGETDNYQAKAMVVDIAADDSIAFGEYAYLPHPYDATYDAVGVVAEKLDDDQFVVMYQISKTGDDPMFGAIGTISGASISFSTYSVYSFSTAEAYTQANMDIRMFDGDLSVFSYADYNTGEGRACYVETDRVTGLLTFHPYSVFTTEDVHDFQGVGSAYGQVTSATFEDHCFVVAFNDYDQIGDYGWYLLGEAVMGFPCQPPCPENTIGFKDHVIYDVNGQFDMGCMKIGDVTAVVSYYSDWYGYNEANVITVESTSYGECVCPVTPAVGESVQPFIFISQANTLSVH